METFEDLYLEVPDDQSAFEECEIFANFIEGVKRLGAVENPAQFLSTGPCTFLARVAQLTTFKQFQHYKDLRDLWLPNTLTTPGSVAKDVRKYLNQNPGRTVAFMMWQEFRTNNKQPYQGHIYAVRVSKSQVTGKYRVLLVDCNYPTSQTPPNQMDRFLAVLGKNYSFERTWVESPAELSCLQVAYRTIGTFLDGTWA